MSARVGGSGGRHKLGFKFSFAFPVQLFGEMASSPLMARASASISAWISVNLLRARSALSRSKGAASTLACASLSSIMRSRAFFNVSSRSFMWAPSLACCFRITITTRNRRPCCDERAEYVRVTAQSRSDNPIKSMLTFMTQLLVKTPKDRTNHAAQLSGGYQARHGRRQRSVRRRTRDCLMSMGNNDAPVAGTSVIAAAQTGKAKIQLRLIVGFGIILTMLVGLAAFSIIEVSAVSASLSTINNVNSVKQRYAINFRGSVHDRAIKLRDVTLVSES